MTRGWFITGTDTEIGKTTIAAGFVHALTAKGKRVSVMKPVASGCIATADGLRNEDALQLIAASGREQDYPLVNPYAFEPPIAPHVAAAQSGVVIEPLVIESAFGMLSRASDAIVVEGVGGFRVPLSDGFDTADMARRLGLPVVLVVGLRLGCINHALLTADAIAARNLELAGWVANCVDAGMQAMQASIDALHANLAAPCLGVVPRLASPDQVAVASHLDLSCL